MGTEVLRGIEEKEVSDLYFCIGGPMDGKRYSPKQYEFDTGEFSVVTYPPLPLNVDLNKEITEPAAVRHFYVRMSFCVDGKRYLFWRHSGLSETSAFLHIIHCFTLVKNGKG